MDINDALRTIGLTEKETAVYLALLQIGRASAYSVAEKSRLKKPTTYVILDELIEKGLAVRIPRVKKQLYVARSPEEAFGVAEEKLMLAKQKLPELLALTKGATTKVSTLYFEGTEGIKQLLEYRTKDMRGKELVGFYARDSTTDPKLNPYFKEEWAPSMQQHGITMRAIVPDHPSLKEYRDADAKFNREIKVVPLAAYSSEVAIDTIGDIVRIHDYKNLQGIAVENADVAKTVREIFEMVWAQR